MYISNRACLALLLKEAIKAKGMTISGLAEKLGVSFPSLSRSVNRSDLSVKQIKDIADALGYEVVIMFEDADGELIQ